MGEQVMNNNIVEAKVVSISSERIRPSTRTESTQRLDLTPWDLPFLALNPEQKGILFSSKPLHSTWLTDLKTSLSTALDHFYILAGRLATESNQEEKVKTISIFVECNNQGADFLYATSDITTSHILSPFHIPPIVHNLFPLNDSINYDESGSQPLLSIQVTELIDGIFIGITMNHMVADGLSFWNFINSWSEICKTRNCLIQKTPIFQRWFLNPTDLPIRIPALTIQRIIIPYSLPPLQEIILHFAPQNILILKEKANIEINNNSIKISSLQAVISHLWIAVTRARNLDAQQNVEFRMAMGNRGRLDPPLPDEYFGNYVLSGNATAKAGELVNGGIGFAARLLNQAVSSHSNANICTSWETFIKEPRFPYFGCFLPDTVLTIGSSPRFNMYGNDFGWGRPIAVRSGCANNHDGKMTAYPGAVAGSMDIEACFSPQTMKSLCENKKFMEFVGPKSL